MKYADKIDRKIPCIFNSIRPGATFMAIKGYRNNFNEVSDFNIVFHFNYINAVKKALDIWVKLPKRKSWIENEIRQQLIRSYSETLQYGFNHRARSVHAYIPVQDANGKVIDGVKLHIRESALHLSGLVVNKRVIQYGDYSNLQKSSVDLARKKLLNMTPLGNYRQFKLVNGRFKSISVNNMSLTDIALIQKVGK